MFDSFGLTQDNFINSGRSFAACERQQHLLNPPRVHEGFLIRTGAVDAQGSKIISFADVPFDFRVMSIWAWQPRIGYGEGTQADSLMINVFFDQVQQAQLIASWNAMPWEFPFNILGSHHSIEIIPYADVNSISVFIQPAKLLDVEAV